MLLLVVLLLVIFSPTLFIPGIICILMGLGGLDTKGSNYALALFVIGVFMCFMSFNFD